MFYFHILCDEIELKLYLGTYSGVSNNRTVWNKRTGQVIFQKKNKRTGMSYIVLISTGLINAQGSIFFGNK